MRCPRLAVVALAFLAAGPAATGDRPVNLLPPDPQQPFSGHDLALCAVPDGFVATWWDRRDRGGPGCAEGCPRVATFDPDGSRIGDEHPVAIDSRFTLYRGPLYLEAVRNGFVLFIQQNLFAVHAVPLDLRGRQTAPSRQVHEAIELHEASFASDGADVVMVYPEWFGCFEVWSQQVGPDAEPIDGRSIVGPGLAEGTHCRNGGIYRSPVVAHRSGYLAAWSDSDLGVRVRQLTRRGAPSGDVVRVRSRDLCTRIVSVASVDRAAYVFDASGCGQQDLFVTIDADADGGGTTLPVAADPLRDEGHDGNRRGLVTAAMDGRIGVVYVDRVAGTSDVDERWWFVEIDRDGRRLGPPLDLTTTFDAEPREVEDVRIEPDPARARYLVHWSGVGPDGYGLWVLPIPTAE